MERANGSPKKSDNNSDDFQLSFFDIEDPKMQEIKKL